MLQNSSSLSRVMEQETISKNGASSKSQTSRNNFFLIACFTLLSVFSGCSKDKVEIQNLIRQTLKWADSKNVIDILPMLTDSKDSIYIGFDLTRHETNLDKLRVTDFFANEFIENYNRIILTLDRKLKNREFEDWLVGDLPPFRFANDVNPWCACQGIPYDNPSPWGLVEIEIIEINNDKAQLIWKWGKLDSNMDSSWEKFLYKFRAVKENGKWKIAYLQEFDFDETTK